MDIHDPLDRRRFLQAFAVAGSAAVAPAASADPVYKVVSRYERIQGAGMPGAYPGQVVAVHSAKCVDDTTEQIQPEVVREMMTRGMLELTGAPTLREAWQRFIQKDDVVGIKVNCVGRPHVVSAPEVVAEVVGQEVRPEKAPEKIHS